MSNRFEEQLLFVFQDIRRRGLSPLEVAKSVTPWWMHRIREFDALEIHPCCVVETMPDGKEAEAICDRADAQFWSVYGHYVPGGQCGGLECFEDFETEAGAVKFYDRLREAYPHLRS